MTLYSFVPSGPRRQDDVGDPADLSRAAGIFRLLVLLFDVTAAVDDKADFFAVLDRLHGYPFGGRLDVADLRVACSLEHRDELLLRERMSRRDDAK
jgi:hypothetical protein